ncbi:MAG: hypothetical protein RIS17_1447 [Pseudomonadota bacterium]|jgi:iron complex transport system ATP-binding protein
MLEATALARPPMLAPTDLALQPGTLTGVIGPNGAGKTTLLRALAGLSDGPGRVTLDGAPLTPGPRTLAWLPASRDAVWPMTAATLVQLGLGPAAPPDAAAVADALTACDATALANSPVNRLSTGERARVLLARAIVARPAWLLLDEPIANLDPGHRIDVMNLLAGEAARGAGVVVALHDLDLAQRCNRLVLMSGGAVVADGSPAEVLSPDNLARYFGVRRDNHDWQRIGNDLLISDDDGQPRSQTAPDGERPQPH